LKTNRWASFLNDWRIEGQLDCSLIKDLDGWEEDYEVKLPVSYREFCYEIGPGAFTDYLQYHILGPANDGPLELGGPVTGDEVWAIGLEGDIPVLEFAMDIGGFSYLWHLDEVTNKSEHEYAIYAYPHIDVQEAIRGDQNKWFISNSFEEFIREWVAIGKHCYFQHRNLYKVLRTKHWGIAL
jgi:hypothetical protein